MLVENMFRILESCRIYSFVDSLVVQDFSCPLLLKLNPPYKSMLLRSNVHLLGSPQCEKNIIIYCTIREKIICIKLLGMLCHVREVGKYQRRVRWHERL